MNGQQLEQVYAIVEESNKIERILKDIEHRDYGMTPEEESQINYYLSSLRYEINLYER